MALTRPCTLSLIYWVCIIMYSSTVGADRGIICRRHFLCRSTWVSKYIYCMNVCGLYVYNQQAWRVYDLRKAAYMFQTRLINDCGLEKYGICSTRVVYYEQQKHKNTNNNRTPSCSSTVSYVKRLGGTNWMETVLLDFVCFTALNLRKHDSQSLIEKASEYGLEFFAKQLRFLRAGGCVGAARGN